MKTRVLSAIVAIVSLAAIFWFWRVSGLVAISVLAATGSIREYSRLTLQRLEAPTHLRFSFFVLTLAILSSAAFFEGFSLFIPAVASILFITMALLTVRSSEELTSVLQIQCAGLVGFIYCGLFPAAAMRILFLDKNAVWFFGLCAIVFAGDTFAYLTGRLLGRRKLLEAVSPNKTIEGAMGGLVGSGLAGLILGMFFLPEVPLAPLVITALATGIFAQAGDLFESLLKRVADVKDSGRIMPGHGGFLDRLDGVLFAAPIYYVLTRFIL